MCLNDGSREISIPRIWSCPWGQVSNSSPITPLKMKFFFNKSLQGDESWVHYWTPSMKKTSMMWKTAGEPTPLKFKECPFAVKNGHCFLALGWSPVSQISSAKDDCHFSFVFQYPCQVANGHQGEVSWTFELRRHFAWWQRIVSHNWVDPNSGKKYEVGKYFKMKEEFKSTVKAFFQKQEAEWYHWNPYTIFANNDEEGTNGRNSCKTETVYREWFVKFVNILRNAFAEVGRFLTNSKNFFRRVFSCYTDLRKLRSMTNSV